MQAYIGEKWKKSTVRLQYDQYARFFFSIYAITLTLSHPVFIIHGTSGALYLVMATPSLPGDKMEREGIRLTVRCVTRSCVNEKQVEGPHSSLHPRLTTPRGRGAFVVQWEKEWRCAKEREQMSWGPWNKTLPNLSALWLLTECPCFPKNCAQTHVGRSYSVLYFYAYTCKGFLLLWTPGFFIHL